MRLGKKQFGKIWPALLVGLVVIWAGELVAEHYVTRDTFERVRVAWFNQNALLMHWLEIREPLGRAPFGPDGPEGLRPHPLESNFRGQAIPWEQVGSMHRALIREMLTKPDTERGVFYHPLEHDMHLTLGVRLDGGMLLLEPWKNGEGSFSISATYIKGEVCCHAVEKALGSESGLMVDMDARGMQGMVAFGPLPPFQAAMMVHVDSNSVVGPVRWGGVAVSVLFVALVWGVRGYYRVTSRHLVRRMLLREQMHERLMQAVPDSHLVLDEEGRIQEINPAGEQMFRYSAKEVLGRHVQHLVPEIETTDDLKAWQVQAEAEWPKVSPRQLEARERDGGHRTVQGRIDRFQLRGEQGYLLILQDVTHLRHTEQELRFQMASLELVQQIAISANEALYPETAILFCLREVCMKMGWQVGHYFAGTHTDPVDLVSTDLYYVSHPEQFAPFTKDNLGVVAANGEGFVCLALQEKRVHWLEDLQNAPIFRRQDSARASGLNTGMIFPVIVGDRVAGVLEFYTTERRSPTQAMLGMYALLGSQLASVVERHEGNERQREHEARLTEAQKIAHLGYWEMDARTRTSKGSNELFSIFGYPGRTEPVHFEDFLHIVHREDQARVREQIESLLEHGGNYAMEFRLMRPDKTFRTVLSKGLARMDEDAVVLSIYGTVQDITDIRKMEQALEENRRLLENVVDAIPHRIYAKDNENRYILVNQAFADFHNRPKSAFFGQTSAILSRFDTQFLSSLEELNHKVLEKGEPVYDTLVYKTPDGAPCYMYNVRAPLRNTAGAITGIIGVTEDVTESRQMEHEIAAQRRLLQTVFDVLPSIVTVKDAQGRYMLVNRTWSETFGITQERALGRTPLELGGRALDDRIRIMDADQRIIRGEVQTEHIEEMRLMPGGKQRVLSLIKTALPDEDGGTTGVITLGEDVTDKLRAEIDLQASEQRYRDLIEGSLHGIVLHKHGKPVMANEAIARMFGFKTHQDIIALDSLNSLIHPEDLPLVQARNRAVMMNPRESTPFSVRGFRKDGSMVWVEIFNRVLEWDGEVVLQSTTMDISERKFLEEQLWQAQKMEAMGQLAGGVAHDFNNVLQIIRGYGELALRKVKTDPAALVGYIERIIHAIEGATTTVRQLLAYSRKEALQPVRSDPAQLLDDVKGMVGRLLGANIQLKVEVEEGLPPVVMDRTLMEQVLINLCVNARDAMPNGGELALHAHSVNLTEAFADQHAGIDPGQFLALSVRDSGVGIPKDQQADIFQPFFTTKPVGEGTGLGLSMAEGITRQHQGLITLDSAPGQGSTFTIYLPMSAQSEDISAMELAGAVLAGGNERLLVAEDDPEVLHLLVEMLISQGYEVVQAHDGVEAINIFDRAPDGIHMAILDVVMPNKGGQEVFEHIRAFRPELPVIFCTGYAPGMFSRDIPEHRHYRMIQKPYSPQQLFSQIREALDDALREQSA